MSEEALTFRAIALISSRRW